MFNCLEVENIVTVGNKLRKTTHGYSLGIRTPLNKMTHAVWRIPWFKEQSVT